MTARLEELVRPGPGDARPAVSVDELKRAWHAVQAGAFRRTSNQARRHTRGGVEPAAVWSPPPGERVLPVVGAAGSVGASTVALGLALAATETSQTTGAAERNVRVIECCSASSSGLAAATTAELGLHETGWRQGTRHRVLIQRTGDMTAGIDDLPEPTPTDHTDQLTIIDVGRNPADLASTGGWLSTAVTTAPAVVIVAPATVPGFRHLETALELLGLGATSALDRIALAVVGPRRRRWPRGVEHSGGPAVRRLLEANRVVEIPHDRTLTATGLDSRPLPAGVTAAATRLLTLTIPTT